MFKKIILSLSCLFILFGCSNNSNEFIIEDRDFSLIKYEHYIPDDFKTKCNEMVDYANDGNFEKVKESYEYLYNDITKVMDYDSVSYINYCEDVNNEELKNENTYAEDLARELKNIFNIACNKITSSVCSKDFEKYIDNDYIYNDYVEYVEKSQELLDLESEAAKLEKDYNKVSDSFSNTPFIYDGEEHTFDELIYSDFGNELYNKDPDKYYELYEEKITQFNKDSGEIYLKLIKIRDKIAKLYGYDNYALYADSKLYNRDYSYKDLEFLKKYTKEYGFKILTAYYMFNDNNDLDINADELVNTVLSKVKTFSPVLEQSSNIFLNNHLYSISSGEGRYNGSFESSLYNHNSGFIFLNCSNNDNDYFTLAHEFGHFTNTIAVKAPNPTVKDGCYDLFEIHSTGLEMLFGLKSEDIFKDNYLLKNVHNLSDKLYTLIDACAFDDWQRAVYENPNMTLDEINQLFTDIYFSYGWQEFVDEYGFPDPLELKYIWNRVPHNFDNPMYYISYGTSSFAALQIFNEANIDFDKGVKIWEQIATNDSYNKGYLEVLNEAGLTPFTSEESVSNLFISLFDYIADAYDELAAE